jgi:hypothetical protein
MTKLLPLKLSSLDIPTSNFSSPKSTHSSMFRAVEFPKGHAKSLSPAMFLNHRFRKPCPLPMIIQPEQYRDTPIYSDPGSPLLGCAHYTDRDNCFDFSPPRSSGEDTSEICDNSSSNGRNFDSGERYNQGIEDLEEPGNLSKTLAMKAEDLSRSSYMSLKCLGQALFRDEASWLSSALNRWKEPKSDCLPHILARNMPSGYEIEDWSSESTTTSYCEDEEDVLVRHFRSLCGRG